MAKYSIPEVNLPKLETEMKTLENKIKKYGGNFYYKVLGQHFEEVELYGEMKKVLYFDIEVEGELKFNDWLYCATIEKTPEGNVIVSRDGGHEVPESYYCGDPKCEHCGQNRYRRYTAVVRNEKTHEFKQIGTACLKDYTNGLDAKAIANLAEFFKNIQTISTPTGTRSNDIYYENTENLLIKLQAYLDKKYIRYCRELEIPSNYDGSRELRPNYLAGSNLYIPCIITWTPRKVKGGQTPRKFYDAFISAGITIEEDKLETYRDRFNKAKAWYAEQADDRGNEFHNYKTLIAQEEIPFEDVGILCNGFVEYLLSDDFIKEDLEKATKIRNEWLEKEAERKVQHDIDLLKIVEELKSYNKSESVENKYANITIVKAIELSKDNYYFVDTNGNLYKLSSSIYNNVDTSKNFVVKNIHIEDKVVGVPNLLYNKELLEDAKFEYYNTDKVKKVEYDYWSDVVTTAENTDEIINDIYDTRAELLDEPEKLNEFIGNEGDVITVELKEGLKKITTSYKGVTLYEGSDELGRVCGIWSKKLLDENVPVEITGKIWKHNSYRGKNSTMLNVNEYKLI